MTIYIEIARRLGHLHLDIVQFSGNNNLTAQPTRLGQAKGHVEHVLLVLAGLWQGIIKVLRQNQVTSTAGADALAGAFKVNLVAVSRVQQ
jgi:hypothetical protein